MFRERRNSANGQASGRPARRLVLSVAGGGAGAEASLGATPGVLPQSTVLVPDRGAAALEWVFRVDPSRRILRGVAYRVAKRGLDLGLITLALPLLAPILLGCYLAIKLGAPGAPAVFVQERTGRDGVRFRMFKFRTMVPGAEKLKGELAGENKLRWPDFKVENDPRITRVGRLLRRTSLDELPQIVNVLRGEMSLVGPRPTSFGVETYQDWHKARLSVAPGVTGLWQIAGRAEMEFDDRVRLDVQYIERQCLALDLGILFHTVGAVVARRGAH